MAVQRRVNWVSQQRVDVPDMRSIESASSNDFDQLLSALILSDLPGYVMRGFDLVMTGAIGGAASGLQMNVSNASLLHPFASESGTYFVVPDGTPVQVLNSAINTQVSGAFTPNSENFVGIDYTRSVDDLTAAQVYLWDPTIDDETTSVLPRALILDFQIVISTGTWATNVLPICTVTTDAGNNVLSIEDNRPLLFRLGTAGTQAPNPFYSYPWTAQPEGRTENPYISTDNAINPFQGGDKMLFTEKDEKDAIKSILKEIKGSAFWYTPGSTSVANVNLSSLFFDTDASVLTMRGKFIHSQSTPGMLTWTGQLNLVSISGPLTYIVAPGTVTLPDTYVAYISLVRDQNFQPSNVFTFVNGSSTINADTLVTGIAAGDWIRFFSDTVTDYQQVASVAGASITLVNPYIGSSAAGIALRAQGSYTMLTASPDAVPADNNTYWIAKRDDNGTITATIAASPTGAVRSGGITTFTTTLPHGINAGQGVQANGVTDASFNQFFEVLTVPTATTLTVQNPGADASSGGGTISSTATIYLRGIGEVSQGESTSDDSSALEALLQYTGAPYAGATQPQYGSTHFLTQGIDLTDAASELDSALFTVASDVNQDRNIHLIEGGTWAYNGVTGVLSWSAPAYIQVPGLADNLNTIAAGSVTLAADQVAYVEINRSGSGPLTLSVVVASASSVTLDDNTVIFARRQPTTNTVIVGSHSFALGDGEASLIDGALGVLDDYFSELRMTAVRPANTRILLSNSDVDMLTGEERSQRISSFLLNFAGAQIDFQTGDIYEADGSTPLGVDFTPTIPAAGQWMWYSVTIIPQSVGSDNRMVGQLLVLPAAATGSSMATAPRAIFVGDGVAIGQIAVTSTNGTTIAPIGQANIVQLGVGSGSGSGSGSLNKVTLFDPLDSALPSSTSTVIDGVTIANGDTVLFSNLASGNNEVYQATVVGGGSSPTLPNAIVLQTSNANPYAGGNMESVTGGVATPQSGNDAYFEIDGSTGGSAAVPALAGSYGGVGYYNFLASPAYWSAQPFVAAVSGPAGTATIRVGWYSTTVGSGLLNVSIYSDDGGAIPRTRISNLATIDTSTLPLIASTGETTAPVTVNLNGVLLTAGSTYWLVIDPTNVTFPGGNSLAVQTGSVDLVEGASNSTNSGASWSVGSTSNNFTVTTGAQILAQNTINGNASTVSYGITSPSNVVAQPFTPSSSGNLAGVQYTITQGTGALTGTYNVALFSDNAGQPGTLIGSVNMSASAIPVTSSLNSDALWSFAATNFGAVTSGTQYWLVWNFASVGSLSGTNYIEFGVVNSAGTQPPEAGLSSNGGTSYTPIANKSATFTAFIGSSGGTVVGSYGGYSGSTDFTGTNFAIQQPFVASASGSLSSMGVDLFVQNGSTYTGYATVGIYTDVAGSVGALISNLAQIPASSIPTGPGGMEIVNLTSGSVTSGTTYHVVIDFTNLVLASGSYQVYVGGSISNPALTNSPAYYSSNNGSDNYPTEIMVSSSPWNAHFAVAVTSSGSVIMAQNTSINTTQQETANNVSLGQTFTPVTTSFLSAAKFQLSVAAASPANTGNLTVKVYTDNAGQPGTLIETSAPINSASLTTTPTVYTFTFSGVNSLTSGTLYHAIVDTSALSGTTLGGTISWTPQPIFASPYTPEIGDEVIFTNGISFANQIAEFNGTTWQVNPVYRSFNGADFWEISSIISTTLINNATSVIFSVTALGSENMVLDYSMLRNGVKETGTAWITNDGTNAQVTSGAAYTGSIGLDLSAAIVSGNLVLSGTLDNSGTDAVIKYTLKRWSDGSGGPTGIPSYNPVLPGGVAASAFTMSDGSSTPYNCSAPFNVGSLTNITLNFSYTVGVDSGSTVGNLSVYVNGQRIPRYISSAVTPSSGGTYYTEVSATQIQFTKNIMISPLSVEIIKSA